MHNKDYAKSYYEKNKERLKQKARERRRRQANQHLSLVPDRSVQEDLSLNTPCKPIKTPPVQENVQAVQGIVSRFQSLKTVALLGLGTLITFLLLHQMLEFYSSDPLPLRIMKALGTEGLILFFSTMKQSRPLAVCMCALSIYTMSAHQIETQILNTEKHKAVSQSVQSLEGSILEKEALQKEFVTKEWLTAGRKNSETLDQLKLKLETLRSTQVETIPQYHNLIGQILTRIFFMIGNILIIQQFSRKRDNAG